MIEDIDLFSYVNPRYKIKKFPIRLIECFAGIGSQYLSLKRLVGDKVVPWKVIEFEKNAIKSYNAIHQTNFAPQDITLTHSSDLEIEDVESYTYILTYSFPCQDLSCSGLGKGMSKGSGTRSGLLWEVERILEELHQEGKHIDVLLMENVPQVIGKTNIKDFQLWRRKLEELGYSNFVKVLDASNYGVPQHRERCFMVSIYGDYHYDFPKPFPLKRRLKDILEDEVDDKYFLSDRMVEGMKKTNFECYKLENKCKDVDGIASTILARFEGAPQCIKIGNVFPSGHEAGRVFDKNGIAPTIKEDHGSVAKVKI